MEKNGLMKIYGMFMLIIMLINLKSTCKGFQVLESELLLSLKSSINDKKDHLSNWNSSLSFCNWNGITCFDLSHVSKIELSGKNLSGRISESIFSLPYIQSIDLSNNQLFGEIPFNFSSCYSLRYLNLSSNNLTGLIPINGHLPVLETLDLSNNMLSGEISEDIGFFSGLTVLDFGGNILSGKIPNSVTNLTRLEFFTLASNQLSGKIPRELGLLKRLKWIYLGYNNFSGEIPKEIGELISLNHLDLVYNNLTGEIPSSLGNLVNLEHLFLYFNNLHGPIPRTIFNLKKLVSLDLSDNYLSGEISEMFSKLQNLEILHLFSNNFSGKIPNSLSFLPHLQVLQLWSNSLSGEIPKELGKFNNLTVLDLSTNNLTGTIPENLCESGHLFKLILFSNSLQGEIPKNLSFCKSLQRIRLQKNKLSGQLPHEFTKLPMVYFLDISSNNLSSRIDDRKWDMPMLQMLNMAKNELSGSLPGTFGSKKLENLDLSTNKFSGPIPEKFGEFSEIMELKLSENQLSGQIPDQLTSCKKLVNLELSHNHLTGEIPISLSNMPVLGQLDLSVNNLTGKIPANLGKVESLVQVNISYNHFHGSLPSTGAFLAINSSAVTSNDKLCGGHKTITGLPPCDRPKSRARWFVFAFLIASVAMFVFVVSLVIMMKERKGGWITRVESDDQDSTWEIHFLKYSRVSRLITMKDIISSIRGGNVVTHAKQFLAEEISTTSISPNSWTDSIRLCCKINHPNIVKMIAMCRSEKGAILVCEYIRGKDLSEVVRELSWEHRLKVVAGIAKALKYLHCYCTPSVIVGEIAPRKIIVDEKNEGHLRLSLHGMNLCSDSKCFNSSAYVAPETKGSKDLTEKNDVYGFGLLLIELLSGKSPADIELGIHESVVEWARYCYSDCHLETWVDKYIIKDNQGLIKDQIVETMNLALQCTAGDPAARPCAADLVKTLESIMRSSSCVSSSSGFKLFFS